MNQNARRGASAETSSEDALRPARSRSRRLLATLVAALPLVSLNGCAGPGYYTQAISGHLRLMRAREDADRLLAQPGADPGLAADLQRARSILEFGRSELGLPESDSYRQVVITGRDAVTWNVVAAPEFSVAPRRWCFPVAGCVPYRGYFERERAEEFAASRARHGDDVLVSPVTAYSTLGWFADPLLDTMFRHDEAELAAVLFHELAHEKLYVRGDTAFNEAYASFVAAAGLRRWADATGRGEMAAAWERRQRAAREFTALLLDTRSALDRIYRAPIDDSTKRERKQQQFDAMRTAYRALADGSWGGVDYFSGWIRSEINNAHVALMAQYQGGECAFAALFREAEGDFARFHALARARSRLSREARREWLETPCDAFASATDL